MGEETNRASHGRMRVAVMVSVVGDPGRRLSRVVTPVRPLRNTRVYPLVAHWGSIRSSRADVLRLGALARLAAVSPHTVVHVPAPPDARDRRNHLGQTPAALVLARDDVGLRVSVWPRLRARTQHGPAPGTRHTMTAPAPRERTEDSPADLRFALTHPERLIEHAGTLFVIAHPRLLLAFGDELTRRGEQIASNRHVHRGGEAYLGDVLPSMGLIGVDPIFHRRRWHTPGS